MRKTAPFAVPLFFLFAWNISFAAADVEPDAGKIWTVPTEEQLRADLQGYLDTFVADQVLRDQILESWPNGESSGPVAIEILSQRILDSLRAASPKVATFLNLCDTIEWMPLPFGQKMQLPKLPNPFHPEETAISPRLTGVLRMYLAKRLIRAHYYDEALAVLREMNPENTIDPIVVLFGLGIVHNELLNKKEGLIAVKLLRDSFPSQSPYSRRFLEVAKLLENELNNIDDDEQKPESIARKMEDIQRRLGQGNTDDPVQKVEKDVLESLEKLIEKLEEQKKQCHGQQGGQGNNPADDSRILRQKGPGQVGEKNLGIQSGWGELPAKEREAALMQIEKEFPSHYRDIIEQYFRQMAK